MLNTMFETDVRQTLDQFRRSVDRMFDDVYGSQSEPAPTPENGQRTYRFSPVVESAWSDTHLNLRAVLPGVTEGDVRVTVQNNQLIVEGERKVPAGFEKNVTTHLPYGKFWAAVTLPNGLNLDAVTCQLHWGVLDIQIPRAEASKPRQIRIQTGAEPKTISA